MSMQQWIEDFPSQLVKAVEISRNANIKKAEGIQQIHITGLGGSGIGGTLAAGYAFSSSKLPITVSKGYDLPSWISSSTLVIVCSYSGNTEETLNAFNQAVLKKAKIICITSGGELENLGNKNNCTVIKIPAGFPPRTCLGYSLVQILKVFEIYNCIPQGLEGEILSAARLLENKKEELKIEGKRIAEFFTKGFPIMYASDLYAGVIERWKQQINENSKMLCHFHVLPEMNHNEMVGWTEAGKNTAVLFIQGVDDDKRNIKRKEICTDVIKKYTPNVKSLLINGDSKLDRILYTIYLGDWVSLSLSEINKVDPVEIRVIELLKSRLAE